MREVLKSRNVLLLAFGQLVSQFGDRLNILACLAVLYEFQKDSTRETTVLWIMIFAPWLLFGPLAGVFVDRWNHKRTMVGCDVIRAVLVLVVPLALWLHDTTWWFLYVLVFLINLVSRFFVPAKLSIVPSLVPPHQLLQANSVLTTSGLAGMVIGLAIGDFAVEFFRHHGGIYLAFYIDSLTYLVSGVALFLLVYHPRSTPSQGADSIDPAAKAAPRTASEVLIQLKDGLVYTCSNRLVLFAIFSLALMMLGGGALVNLVNVMIRSQFEGHVTAPFGQLLTAFTLGGGTGAYLLGRCLVRVSRKRVITVGFLLASLGIAMFPVAFSLGGILIPVIQFYVVLAVAFTMGTFIAPVLISCDTLIQEVVPKDKLGRVFATREAALALFTITGVACAGVLDLVMGKESRGSVLIGVGLFMAAAGAIWSIWIGKAAGEMDARKM